MSDPTRCTAVLKADNSQCALVLGHPEDHIFEDMSPLRPDAAPPKEVPHWITIANALRSNWNAESREGMDDWIREAEKKANEVAVPPSDAALLEGIAQFIENSIHTGWILTEDETPLDDYGKEVAKVILGVVRDRLKGDETDAV